MFLFYQLIHVCSTYLAFSPSPHIALLHLQICVEKHLRLGLTGEEIYLKNLTKRFHFILRIYNYENSYVPNIGQACLPQLKPRLKHFHFLFRQKHNNDYYQEFEMILKEIQEIRN